MKKPSFLKKFSLKSFNSRLAGFSGLVVMSGNAFASSTGGNLPFVSVLNTVASTMSGPVALSVATILVVATGLMNAFGEWSDGMKKIVNIAFWTSTAFGAASLLTTFGSTGATF